MFFSSFVADREKLHTAVLLKKHVSCKWQFSRASYTGYQRGHRVC
jgi:hypothetical protein